MTTKEFDKSVEKQEEEEKEIKRRKKNTRRAPSLKQVRKHLQKIIKYHKRVVNESIPSIYPILGPVNLEDYDGEDHEDRGTAKMTNTKKELKRKQ